MRNHPHPLNLDNCYIKKTIRLHADRGGGREYYAELIYLRKLSAGYRMKSPVERTPEEQFQVYLNGIPEVEFPSDSLDDAIYDAVHNQYDVELPRSSTLILTTELRDALRYREYRRGSINISVSPNIDDVYEVPPNF